MLGERSTQGVGGADLFQALQPEISVCFLEHFSLTPLLPTFPGSSACAFCGEPECPACHGSSWSAASRVRNTMLSESWVTAEKRVRIKMLIELLTRCAKSFGNLQHKTCGCQELLCLLCSQHCWCLVGTFPYSSARHFLADIDELLNVREWVYFC